jgi:hypothetical protein
VVVELDDFMCYVLLIDVYMEALLVRRTTCLRDLQWMSLTAGCLGGWNIAR